MVKTDLIQKSVNFFSQNLFEQKLNHWERKMNFWVDFFEDQYLFVWIKSKKFQLNIQNVLFLMFMVT